MAVEHTRVESISDQTLYSARFTRAFGPLKDELQGMFPYSLRLIIPYENVSLGQNWVSIRLLLRDWLLTHASALQMGKSDHRIRGIPFPVTIYKDEGLPHGLSLARFTPPGEIEEHLLQQMQKALSHKHEALGRYRLDGAAGVLVLECEDIALVNQQILYRAYLLATRNQPRPNHDQVWLVQSFFDDGGVFCFHGPELLMNSANPQNLHFGPKFEKEWLRD